MHTRTISSVFVVVVGLVPLLLGGPPFALLMAVLGIVAYREFIDIGIRGLGRDDNAVSRPGVAVIAAFAAAGLLHRGSDVLFAVAAVAVVAPFLLALTLPDQSGAAAMWSLATAGTFYLGLPVYAAVALRAGGGEVSADWLRSVAEIAAPAWAAAPRGLAWTLLVVLATWIGDSAALLVGRRFGRRKLAPRLSPNKTVEGSLGGLAGAMVVGAITAPLFGLGPPLLGAIVGAVLGVTGQLGDLCESLLKRQAGLKDSGTIIPGHGGILDRIDALLFAFPAGLLLATLIDRWAWR